MCVCVLIVVVVGRESMSELWPTVKKNPLSKPSTFCHRQRNCVSVGLNADCRKSVCRRIFVSGPVGESHDSLNGERESKQELGQMEKHFRIPPCFRWLWVDFFYFISSSFQPLFLSNHFAFSLGWKFTEVGAVSKKEHFSFLSCSSFFFRAPIWVWILILLPPVTPIISNGETCKLGPKLHQLCGFESV